ncbi:thioredoxin family protein [Virgibacillus sp. NKC19-16]|uniref:thioredoxin family protein n=1 Tax=Virgibacillus salidurans TaxID=2831673 RepID=UPI001F31830C|nr:thioredoxin family protein [Virgibacillus sp. NKC19-16]UJL47581.1 thioredoxin family protein [Virgibacillus sp. NKC19-16]
MKKKLFIFGGIIIVLFVALFFVTNYQNNQTVENEDNPYGTTDLEQGTIDQLDDPLYDNQVMPDELSETVESGEEATVYFYSPDCAYCQQTTPYLAPLAEDMEVDLKKFNLLEFGQESLAYGIESTPTVVHYENGEEVSRLVGQHPEEEYEAFFDQYVLD